MNVEFTTWRRNSGGVGAGTTGLSLLGIHHFAAVIPSTATQTDDVLLYIDGSLQTIGTTSGTPQTLNTGGVFTTLGSAQGAGFYQGSFSGLRVYDKELPAADIIRLANMN